MDKLIQEGIDLLTQLGPIISQTVPLEHVAAQPVPELLNGVEPGRIGGQPDGLQPRQLAQRGLDVGMVVDRPVILHDVDALHASIDLIELSVEGVDLLASHPIVVQVVDLARERVQGADDALLPIGRSRVVQLARAGGGAAGIQSCAVSGQRR
jgi:hypothetical protein